MPKPPKLSLASIVAASSPQNAPHHAASRGAQIVALDRAPPPSHPINPTLKQRAKQMSVYLEPPVYDQLRDLAYAERTKMHALMLEALDLLFRQRGTRSIEQIIKADQR